MRTSRYIRMNIHPSGQLMSAACGFLAGCVMVGEWYWAPLASPVVFLCSAFAMILLIRYPKRYLLALAFLAGFATGLYRSAPYSAGTRLLDSYRGSVIDIQGILAQDLRTNRGGGMSGELYSVRINGTAIKNQIPVSMRSSEQIRRGDRIIASGTVTEFNGKLRLRLDDISIFSPVRTDWALSIRDVFAAKLRLVMGEPYASLGLGFLVGLTSDLPEELVSNMRMIGLSHILVASGYNLTVLIRYSRRYLKKVSRFSALFGSVFLVLFFVCVSGFSPSLVRAAIVSLLSLGAWYYGRVIKPFPLLLLSAAISVWLNPYYIKNDIGWYLSYTSFIGIIVVAPLIKSYFFGSHNLIGLASLVIDTSAASVTTLPYVLYVFGQSSPLALFSNLAVLPVIPLAMFVSFIAGITGFIAPGMARFAEPLFVLPFRYIIWVVGGLSSSRWSTYTMHVSLVSMLAAYAVLACACVYMWKKTSHRFNQNFID